MLMTADHLRWQEFVERLAGEEGIHTRFVNDRLTWSCDHTRRMVFTRYVLEEFGADVEASVAWFLDLGWACDCAVVFLSDASWKEIEAWKRRVVG